MASMLDINTLVEIQEGILSGRYDLEEASKRILEQACQSVKAEFGQILLLDREDLVVRSSTRQSDVGIRVSVNDSVSGLAALENKAIVVGDSQRNEPYKSQYKSLLGAELHSELAVPLNLGNKIIGVINLESPRQNAFNENDVEILLALAVQSALAFRIAEELELRKRSSEQAKLASIGVLSGDIVHRLNSPLAAIKNTAELILMDYGEILNNNTDLAEMISDIKRIAMNGIEMVGTMKRYAREEVLQQVNLKEIISYSLAESAVPESVIIENRILEDKKIYYVLANRNLTRVFTNLIKNAIEAMPNGGKLILDIRPAGSDFLEIVIEDTGIGIPDDFRDEIFNILSVFSKNRAGGGGGGLGLWYSRAFVEACGGTMPDPESVVGKGTRFIVKLPLAKGS